MNGQRSHNIFPLRFCILFFSAAFFSGAIAVFSLKSKRFREPTVLAFLSYTLFNGTNPSIAYLADDKAHPLPSFDGHGHAFQLESHVGLSSFRRCRHRSRSLCTCDRCPAQCTTCAHVSTAPFPRLWVMTYTVFSAVSTGLVISVRSLGGTVGLAICRFRPSRRAPGFLLQY